MDGEFSYMDETMNLIFCPFPRCGSTSLCISLQNSCSIEILHEPESLDQIHSANLNNIKALSTGLNQHDNCTLIDNSSNLVFLYRQNLLDIVTSYFASINFVTKSGIGIWNFAENSNITEQDKNDFLNTVRPDIDKHFFQETLIDVIERTHYYHSYIKDNHSNYTIVAYEELYGSSDIFIDIAARFKLTIRNDEYKHVLNRKNKINTRQNYHKIINNYRNFFNLYKDLNIIL